VYRFEVMTLAFCTGRARGDIRQMSPPPVQQRAIPCAPLHTITWTAAWASIILLDMRRTVAVFGCALGCGSPPSTPPDASTDGGVEGPVISIGLPPLTLTPTFSTSISDYYVRCADGENALTLIVGYPTGETQSPVTLVPDQEISVSDQYWIRCLPSDFPVLTASAPPDAGAPTPGYYLVDSLTYAMVLDVNGTPIWYGRGSAVADVESLATDTISFVPNATLPYGYDDTVDFTLKSLDPLTTTTLTAVGSPTDVHELRLLPNGHYLLFTYPIETGVDLTGLETYGTNQTMADCAIQEIDGQNNLVWSWLASDHIDPVKESIEPEADTVNGATVIDVFHCNAIDVDSTGNLLLSARHTNAIFYIDRTSGTVTWKLGGAAYNKDSAQLLTTDTSDPEGSFSLQHDARFAATSGHITMFDDHGAPTATGVARGVEYALDFTGLKATVVFEYLGIGPSLFEGSFRRYADGHSVIGWGSVAGDPRILTEVDQSGNDVLDISSSGGPSYRSVKVPLSQLNIALLRSATAK
jgi:Arylsulfotransferase (ASST)